MSTKSENSRITTGLYFFGGFSRCLMFVILSVLSVSVYLDGVFGDYFLVRSLLSAFSAYLRTCYLFDLV